MCAKPRHPWTCSPLWSDKPMTASIHLDDLDAEQRKPLGIRKPRESQFTKDELRVGLGLSDMQFLDLDLAERKRRMPFA
jgi:hypothetical protein